MEQYAIKKFAEAFEIVPRALAENSGFKVSTNQWGASFFILHNSRMKLFQSYMRLIKKTIKLLVLISRVNHQM